MLTLTIGTFAIALNHILLIGALIGLKMPLPEFGTLDLDPLNRFKEPDTRFDITYRSGPVMIMVDYIIAYDDIPAFLAAMSQRRRVRIRDGAQQWALLRDPQVKAFIAIVWVAALLLTGYQIIHDERDWFSALTHSLFNVVSVITTCGYASEDYSLWGSMAVVLFFYLTFSGGCSGSTSGGLKIFRTQLAGYLLLKQLNLLIHPNAIWTQKYGSKKVDDALLGVDDLMVQVFAALARPVSAVVVCKEYKNHLLRNDESYGFGDCYESDDYGAQQYKWGFRCSKAIAQGYLNQNHDNYLLSALHQSQRRCY